MSISDKILMFAQEKENIRYRLNIPENIPFSEYSKYLPWQGGVTIPNAKIYADFKNDRYAKNGVPCSFSDLFTFSRAGKAWLVKDTGLQEYADDVPRFDNGLLIEREATNFCLGSDAGATDNHGIPTLISNNDFGSLVPEITECSANPDNIGSIRYNYQFLTKPYATTLSAYVRTDAGTDIIGFSINPPNTTFFQYDPVTSEIQHDSTKNKVTVSKYRDWVHLTVGCLEANNYFLHEPHSVLADENDSFYIALRQAEFGEASSYILTTTTPVTRPADFLLNKITGTTVTGDWDSTLTLSIVAGQLVHNGYGRIRSLEIN